MSESTEIRVDEKMKQVLNAIKNEGWEATTSDITQATNIDNDLVRYRFNKLSDAGFANLSRAQDSEYTIAPLVITVTDKGQEWARSVLTDQGEGNLTREELNSALEDLIERYNLLIEKYDELEKNYERQQTMVDALAQAVDDTIDEDFREFIDD